MVAIVAHVFRGLKWALAGRFYKNKDEDNTPTWQTEEEEDKRLHGPNDELEPWQLALQTNLTNSTLYAFPDELLEAILLHASTPTIQALRSSGRRFLNLFEAKAFDHLRLGMRKPRQRGLLPAAVRLQPCGCVSPVSRFNHRLLLPHERDELKAALQRDAFCPPCLALRTECDGDDFRCRVEQLQSSLHCTPCRRAHPALFFSREMRRGDREERVCIGREGYFRLCVHKTLSYEAVEKMRQGRYRWSVGNKVKGAHGFATASTCRHLAHNAPDGEGARASRGLGQGRWVPKVGLREGRGGEGRGLMLDVEWTGHVRNQADEAGVVEFKVNPGLQALLNASTSRKDQCQGGILATTGPSGTLRYRRNTTAAAGEATPEWFVRHPVQAKGQHASFVQSDWVGCKIRFTKPEIQKRTAELLVEYKKTIFRTSKGSQFSPTEHNWLCHLDEDSYGLTEDEETKHVVWCDSAGCATMRNRRQLHKAFFDFDMASRYHQMK